MKYSSILKSNKYPHLLQHSEEDCGAASLAMVAKYYGRSLTLSRTREAVGTGQTGTTLLGLKRGADILGFNARSVKTTSDVLKQLDKVDLPVIIHWRGCHWVVLYGKQEKDNRFVVADPAVGIRYLSKRELVDGWTDWIMLLLEPDPVRFLAQPNEEIDEFGKFFRRIYFHRRLLAQVLLMNAFLGLLSLASPFLVQILTDDVLVRGDTGLLATVSIAVIVMNLISGGINFVQSVLIANFAQRLELGLVLEFGRQILRLPLTYYEARRSGEIASRLRDIQMINQLVAQVIVSLPSQVFIAFISLGFMCFYSWKLTLAALFIAAFMTLSTVVFLPTLQQKTRSVLVIDAENQGVLVETFKGALTLKTTTSGAQFWEEFQSRFSHLATLTLDTIYIGIINSSFSNLTSNIGNITLIWLGGSLVINPAENLSIGQLFAFKAMNDNCLLLISTVIKFVDEFARVKAAAQRLSEVINATPENQDDYQKPFVKISAQDTIIGSELNFHYAGRLELLEEFNLEIPGGQIIALIGKSGCGKSTLVKLIAGLYPLQSGNIRFGSYNLQDLPLDCLRQQVILVPQEAHFWNRSIIENFRLGNPDLPFEKIVAACQIAEADKFISRLPDKYQTILGEFGANISGGQRQRLAIARALVTDPPILILDESTSGLDPVSETQVLDQLFEHRQGQTTILISHRPRVIKRADWIVLLEQGRVKVQGSLSDLSSTVGAHLDFLIP
jgi:ATP-binding cassette subfamily C protein